MVEEILTIISDTLSGWAGLIIFLLALYVLVTLGRIFWLIRIRKKFIDKMEWVILEVKIPKENLKSPKAMEQVFASLHGSYSFSLKWIDKWWYGKVEDWM